MCSHRHERKDRGPYGPRDSPWVCHGCMYSTKKVPQTMNKKNMADAGPKTHRRVLDGWGWAQCVHIDTKGKMGAHTGHMTARGCVTVVAQS